jgi:hypothetical protein
MVATYGRIRARDLEKNLIDIAKPWNPDTDIEHVFSHGTLCREIAIEGGNPITDASHVLILVKIFRESGVFPIEIREWSRLPEANKTVDRCIEFFTEAYENRLEETLQGTLSANAAKATTPTQTPTATIDNASATLGNKWGYCHTHGLCQHSSATCRTPAQNHKQNATLDNPMGGSSEIRFPGQQQRRNQGRQKTRGKQTTSGATTATASTATQVSTLTEEE